MRCEHCAQRGATIQFTIIKGDRTRVEHLCEDCADALSIAESGHPLEKITAEDLAFSGERERGGGESPMPPWLWIVLVALLGGGIALLVFR